MELACILLLVFCMRGVQTTLVNIYDRSYEKIILKTFRANFPSEIKMNNSNIILYVKDIGYEVGTYDDLHGMWEVDGSRSPEKHDNFTDRFNKVMECEYNQLVYLVSHWEQYVVYTGNSSNAVGCEMDYFTSYGFIISSTTEDPRMGKLYVLNTGQFVVNDYWLATQEIKEVGDRVTAVGLGPSYGDILITAATESSRPSFNLILLKQLQKDITTLEGFAHAVENAKENITKLFEADCRRRSEKFIQEIHQIHAEVKEKKIPDLPYRINMNVSCKDDQLKELINKTASELIQMFDENIVGNEPREHKVREIQCTNNMNKLRAEATDYRKKIKNTFNSILPTSIGSSVSITKDKCLEILAGIRRESFSCALTQKMDYNQIKYHEYDKVVQYAIKFLISNTSDSTHLDSSTVVTILGKDHEMKEVKTYFGDAPSFIQYQTFLSSLLMLINGRGYDIGRDFSSKVSAPWFKPKIQDRFTDMAGNILECKDGRGMFSPRDKATTFSIFPKNLYIVQCHGDYEKSRAFIIVSKTRGAKMGKLFVLDTKNYIVNAKVNAKEIKDVGRNITAVTVRPLTGEVLISQKVIISKEKAFRLILIHTVTKEEVEVKKPYPKGMQEFKHTLDELKKGLIDRYDKGWKNSSRDLIIQYYSFKSKINPIKEEISNGSALHDSFNDPLKVAVTAGMERVSEIYHYNLAKLDDRITDERRERRICQAMLNTFQAKMIRDIDNVFLNYNSETDGTHTERWPDQFSEATCTKILSGIHDSYSCARTDELRAEKRHLVENEKFLKKLRRMIIDLEYKYFI